MQRSFEGRSFLVTGSGKRLGRAIARALLEGGARRVALHAWRSVEAAAELAREFPDRTEVVCADLRDAEAPAGIFRALDRMDFDVESVVHGASSFPRVPFRQTDAQLWDEVFALEVRAFFLLARELVERRGDRGGVLIALGDTSSYEFWPSSFAHSVAKAALLDLVRALARSLAPHFRVNAVVPGPVLPPEGTPAEEVAKMARRTLLGRLGEPADVVDAVGFLLRAPYATASILDLHGGSPLWRGGVPEARPSEERRRP